MSLTRCVDCGDMYENTLYEGRCPHRMRHDPTPPAPAMPDEVRALVTSTTRACGGLRIAIARFESQFGKGGGHTGAEREMMKRALSDAESSIAAVEAKYGGSR